MLQVTVFAPAAVPQALQRTKSRPLLRDSDPAPLPFGPAHQDVLSAVV